MRITYSSEDIVKLKQNPNVFNCMKRLLSYTYEFKKHALELHKEGVYAKEIWRRAGFDEIQGSGSGFLKCLLKGVHITE